MKTADIYWLAGLLEGEGCFGHNRSTPFVALGMTDLDVVSRARDTFGYGNICARAQRSGCKTLHSWTIHGSDAIGLMLTLWPLLGERRRERIGEIVLKWRATPGKPRGRNGVPGVTCKRGHPYDDANSYIKANGTRQCKTCVREAGESDR